MGHQRIAGRAFVESDECLMLTGSDDLIALPVAKALALIGDSRTFVDGDLVRDGATALLATPIAFPARLLATQGEVQHATRRLVSVDALVDAFVADGGLGVGLEVTGNLLGAPGLGQLGIDEDPGGVRNARSVLAALQALLCEFVGLLGPAASLAPVARYLPTYGRLVPVHQASNVTAVMPSLGQHGNLVTFVSGEVRIAHIRATLTWRSRGTDANAFRPPNLFFRVALRI